MTKNGGIMGAIHGFLESVVHGLSRTLRRFVAFSMAMFFLGALFGFFIPHITKFVPVDGAVLLSIPLVLAVLSYYFTEIAALVFILLLGLFLLVFL